MPLIDDEMDESTPELVAQLRARFLTTDVGVIIDNQSNAESVWCGPNAAFERWFSELESLLNITLGRRLAYASAESEERRWIHAPPLPKSWLRQQSKRVAIVNKDWALRGLGQFDILESDDEKETLIVANRAHSSISAGIANAAWECISEKRFRFQWSDRGAGETLIEVSEDLRSIPSPTEIVIPWKNMDYNVINTDAFFERARHEAEGVWTVEGNRGIILYHDQILRFENLSLPYLSECERGSDFQTEWIGLEDDDKLVFWDAMANASRQQFLASGELVLVADPEHWIGISKQHLSKQGLGIVNHVESLDNHGGVRLGLPALFHPALTVGKLLGCWERSEGRQGRATWKSLTSGHEIELRSKREIAD